MKEIQKNRSAAEAFQEKRQTSPRFWYGTLTAVALILIWILFCIGIFVWQMYQMKDGAAREFENFHKTLLRVESQCSEQVKGIYNEPGLLQDFWLFWNNSIDGYMAKRLDVTRQAEEASFPEYMNKFITEYQEICQKIFFVTANAVYSLQMQPNGGGGAYSYNVSYSQYMEECQRGTGGYPIFVNVQDIEDRKINVGRMVFLCDYEYLLGNLKEAPGDYMILEKGNIQETFGESQEEIDTMSSWIYREFFECKDHHNYVQMGFRVGTIVRKCMPYVLMGTCFIGLIAWLMQGQIRRINRSNEEFLDRFIHTIRLAKEGTFSPVELGERKDTYAMLASEINEMIVNLDLHIKEEYLLKIKQQETEMKALLYQINPHFLYNTLEIIRAQASMQRDEGVADALFDLGSMYRLLVKLGNVITLKQELSLLTHYLNIMEIGHQDNFYYEVDVEEGLMEMETVKFWLQPLAENYFVHGYDSAREWNLFMVQGRKEATGIRLRIFDNGKGMGEDALKELNRELNQQQEAPKSHIGLKNVCMRLRYFYREKIHITVCANVPRGFCIDLFIQEGSEEDV